MKNVIKFLGLIFGSLFILLMVLSTVRMWGEGQRYVPYDAEYFSSALVRPNEELILPWEQSFLLEKEPQAIIWIESYLGVNTDEQGKEQPAMLAMPWADRDKPKKLLEKKANPTRPLLSDLLRDLSQKYPQARFIVACDDNRQAVDQYLVEDIEQSKAQARVMIQSQYDTIIISTRERKPTWLYGSSLSDLARIKTMDSLFLLPAAQFKGDVLISPLKHKGRETVSRDIVMEMKKRFKKVFIGPVRDAEELKAARELGADGIIYDHLL